VWSDTARTLVATHADGSLETTPLDPDHVDGTEDVVVADQELAAEIAEHLSGYEGPWRFVYTVGEPTHALAHVAHEHDAWMILVGSRRAGLGGWMNRLVGGSTAGRLAHTQPIPVTIVPQHPKESP
jgi:nucleotide-binding universal stress UspA family protein